MLRIIYRDLMLCTDEDNERDGRLRLTEKKSLRMAGQESFSVNKGNNETYSSCED